MTGEFVGQKRHDERGANTGATVYQSQMTGVILSDSKFAEDDVELSSVGGETSGANAVRQRDEPEARHADNGEQSLAETSFALTGG